MSLNSFLTQLEESDADVSFGSMRVTPIDTSPNEICRLAREHGLSATTDTTGDATDVVIRP